MNVTVHGQVLEQWPRMFQILSLFCKRILKKHLITNLNILSSGLEGETE